MDRLSNDMLLEAYEKAQQLNLDEDFIQLLLEEMQRRKFMKQHS